MFNPDNTGVQSRCQLTLEDLKLQVKVPKGTDIQKDITCNSEFMLENIDDIGIAIWKSYHFEILELLPASGCEEL